MEHRNGKLKYRGSYVENTLVKKIDKLAEFEEYCHNILPALRKEIAKGSSAEEIYSKFAHLAAARGVTIAMTEVDSGKALSAIREILDRSSGKAVERHQVQHKFEKLKDEELDALLLSRAKEVGDESEE